MRRRDSGFTLIELVVALALAGLVSLLLLQGLRLTVSGTARLSLHADRLDDRTSVALLLRRALETAASGYGIARGGFTGTPDRLSFVTLAEDGGAGFYRVELALAGSGPRQELVLTRRLAGPFGVKLRQRSVLARHVGAFQLAYFGATEPSAAPRWHRRWQNLGDPPLLVRIVLDADGAAPPPIVVRLWAAGEMS